MAEIPQQTVTSGNVIFPIASGGSAQFTLSTEDTTGLQIIVQAETPGGKWVNIPVSGAGTGIYPAGTPITVANTVGVTPPESPITISVGPGNSTQIRFVVVGGSPTAMVKINSFQIQTTNIYRPGIGPYDLFGGKIGTQIKHVQNYAYLAKAVQDLINVNVIQGSASPGGPNQSIQVGINGIFNGYSGFTYTDSTSSVAQTGTSTAPSYTFTNVVSSASGVLGSLIWKSSDGTYLSKLVVMRGSTAGGAWLSIQAGPKALGGVYGAGVGNINCNGDTVSLNGDTVSLNPGEIGTTLIDGETISLGNGVASGNLGNAIVVHDGIITINSPNFNVNGGYGTIINVQGDSIGFFGHQLAPQQSLPVYNPGTFSSSTYGATEQSALQAAANQCQALTNLFRAFGFGA